MCPEGCGGKLIDSAQWIDNSKGLQLCKDRPTCSAMVQEFLLASVISCLVHTLAVMQTNFSPTVACKAFDHFWLNPTGPPGSPTGGQLCQLGGKWVVNPSGGLESKGHPIGATGIAQCAELCWQVGETHALTHALESTSKQTSSATGHASTVNWPSNGTVCQVCKQIRMTSLQHDGHNAVHVVPCKWCHS